MRAWQVTGPGSVAKTLRLNESAVRPSATSLAAGQLLVKVVSTALNPADHKVPELGIVSRGVISYPKTPGMDVAGLALAVGPEVNGVKEGDRVMGRLDPMKSLGSLAEEVVFDKGSWVPVPAGVEMDQAAGLLTVGLTAYQCIAPYVKPGDQIFINGGTGGTGTFGIQVGKALGCHVTTTCSTKKVELCKELGADEVIDYTKEDVMARLKAQGSQKAVIVDNIGKSPSDLYAGCHEILREGGTYVFVGGQVSLGSAWHLGKSLLRPAFLGGQRRKFTAYMTKNSEEELARLAGWMGEGKLRTVVDSTYGFEEVKEALAKVSSGTCTGKVIVHVADV